MHVAAIEDAKKLRQRSWPDERHSILAEALSAWAVAIAWCCRSGRCVPDLGDGRWADGGSKVDAGSSGDARPLARLWLAAWRRRAAQPFDGAIADAARSTCAADLADLQVDAGPTTGGLESTVLDLTTTPPRLLRPGLVTRAELEALLGPHRCADKLNDRPDGHVACTRSDAEALRAAHAAGSDNRKPQARRRVEPTGRRVGWLTHAANKRFRWRVFAYLVARRFGKLFRTALCRFARTRQGRDGPHRGGNAAGKRRMAGGARSPVRAARH